MLSYSPMDNIRAQPYPNMLIVAGLHDPRVAFWEPAKWASRLRAATTNYATHSVLLKIDLNAGHFSASDRYRYWRETAFDQAFVLSHIAPAAAK
jgi:oligopeptidase B